MHQKNLNDQYISQNTYIMTNIITFLIYSFFYNISKIIYELN
jgi:hypothetical protein